MKEEDVEQESQEEGWLRLELLTPNADFASGKLVQLGALGIEVQDAETFMDDAPFAPLPDGQSRLIAFFEAGTESDSLRTQIEEAFVDVEIVSLADYQDRSWETAWMKYFQPTQISRRVAVGPPWDAPQAPAEGVAITIEPGMAFGTGTHETTRLCARFLDELLEERPAQTLLDVGCGSAILSMIAAGLGVGRVVGIDIDKTSIEVAGENIAKNGFSEEEICLSTRPLGQISESFDVVVANILAHILLDLRSGLHDAVAPGGELLLSGIPVEELDKVRAAFVVDDFREVSFKVDGEWTALHLRRDRGES